MALSAKLQLRQTQSLVITPQLLQAIRLLQMSSLELKQYVVTQLEENPLLEQEEGASPGPPVAAPDSSGWKDDGSYSACRQWSSAERPLYDLGFDQTIPATEGLTVVLEREIDALFADAPVDRAVAHALLAGLDEAGYLTHSVAEIGGQLAVSAADVERVLVRCQEIAPAGIFARSLKECLTLQLEERRPLDPPMRALLDNLEGLAGDRTAVALLCGVDEHGLDRLLGELRSLDPKPGLAYEHEPIRTLIPDVFVRRGPDGSWHVELNDAVLPRLIVNRAYYASVSARASGEGEQRFLSECLQQACWLERSLDQRARTVLRVASEIVSRQEGFLADGVEFLRPLSLRMVADALGIHESTVSRATANKTMATPRGNFEFRHFFGPGIPASAGGDAHSAAAVRHRIRKLIAEESPQAVLSDDAIAATLSDDGVEIARRTVAKYRELMRIGSSVERRRAGRFKVAS